MSGLEIIQVVASVSELVRLSYLCCQFFVRLKNADKNAKESLQRIKQLHEIAYGVKLALERRQEQAGKSVSRGEKAVWNYVDASIGRCKAILLQIRKIYTPFQVETQPTLVEKAVRQFRIEVIRKGELSEQYSALNTQLQALQLNTQTLNTFISISASDKIDNSKEEILDAIARLERYHSKCSLQLNELVQRREDVPPMSPRRLAPLKIGVTSPDDEDVDEEECDAQDDISVMQGALTAAWDLISTYDPSGQSVLDRLNGLDLDDIDVYSLDSGVGSADLDLEKTGEIPMQLASGTRRRSSARQLPLQPVKHVHATSRRVLDGCIAKYQLRVQHALSKDQVHTAEADLQQLMTYANERKQKYDIDYNKVQMLEQLAQIKKRQGKHTEVFIVLHQLLPAAESSEAHTLENSRHYQLIAETYYELWESQDRKDDLHEAQNYALTAFTIREELAACDEMLQQSAILLAKVYEALDLPVEAEVYRDMFAQPVIPCASPQLSHILDREVTHTSGSGSQLVSLSENTDANKELVRAIKDRNVAKVRQLLQTQDVNLDYRTKQYQTPLHYAFQKAQGNESMPLALLEHGFAIDADDENGRTVLHQAAARADVDMVRLAIHRDAAKEAKDKSRLTPLLIAVKEGPRHRERQAVLDTIEVLLDEKCDPKARDQDGWTVLHHAAHNSATLTNTPKASATANAILELLLQRLSHASHSALEAKDKNGYTPLLGVAGAGDPVTIAMLLDAGADVSARNGAERSVMYLAVRDKPDIPRFANVIKLLADRGALIDESEIAKDDFKKFKHLLTKSENTRRLSSHPRRASEGKSSVHQLERSSTSGTSNSISQSQTIFENEGATESKRTSKSSSIRNFFSGRPQPRRNTEAIR